MRENVENFAEQGLISKKLATILLDVPIELDEKSLELEDPNKEILEPLFAELEFRTLGKRVFGEDFSVLDKSSPTNGQMDLFSTTTTTITTTEIVTEVSVENAAINNIHNTAHEYVLVDTNEKQVALAQQLASWIVFVLTQKQQD
jgi:DNA polymerase-1